MDINIYRYIEGSKEARGLAVIIDVFRAFSLECYLFSWGAERIYPAGTIDEAQILARKLSDTNPDKKIITIGERQGIPLSGFTYGNSPSQIEKSLTESLKDVIIVHTTSAGTQGIVNSINASEVITGSLVNARAVSEYIKRINPDAVSLVAMGNSGIKEAPEDELCAQYIRALLEDNCEFINSELPRRIEELRFRGGKHFFNLDTQNIFPSEDFYMCVEKDRFNFIIRSEKRDGIYINNAIEVI